MTHTKNRSGSGYFLAGIVITLFAFIQARPASTQTQSASETSDSEIILSSFWSVIGTEVGGEFAYTAASAGDVNNDGFGDILVGSPRYSTEDFPGGAAFVYHGGPLGVAESANWFYGGATRGERFGGAAASAGDVNNDGYDDVVIGSYRYRTVKAEDGCAFLFLGSPTGLEETPSWAYPFTSAGGQFGYSVAGAGDVNNDGFDDVIIGARLYEFGEVNEGAAFLFFGSKDGLESAPRWMYESNQQTAGLGTSVAGIGDVNNDGYDDILVGAPQYTINSQQEGAAFLFFGSANGPSASPDWIASGGQTEAAFGTSVSGAGDVNDDGYADVIVGAPSYRLDLNSYLSQGAAFLFYGTGSGLQEAAGWQAFGNQTSPEFGISVSAAGDVNGDEIDDLVVGAHLLDDDQPDEGGIYVYLGSKLGLSTIPAFSAFGDKAEAELGFDAHFAGDINKDGFDDIIAGAPRYRYSELLYGRAYLFSGEASFPKLIDSIFLPFIVRP